MKKLIVVILVVGLGLVGFITGRYYGELKNNTLKETSQIQMKNDNESKNSQNVTSQKKENSETENNNKSSKKSEVKEYRCSRCGKKISKRYKALIVSMQTGKAKYEYGLCKDCQDRLEGKSQAYLYNQGYSDAIDYDTVSDMFGKYDKYQQGFEDGEKEKEQSSNNSSTQNDNTSTSNSNKKYAAHMINLDTGKTIVNYFSTQEEADRAEYKNVEHINQKGWYDGENNNFNENLKDCDEYVSSYDAGYADAHDNQ